MSFNYSINSVFHTRIAHHIHMHGIIDNICTHFSLNIDICVYYLFHILVYFILASFIHTYACMMTVLIIYAHIFMCCYISHCKCATQKYNRQTDASLTLARFCGTHWHDWSRTSSQTSRKLAWSVRKHVVTA